MIRIDLNHLNLCSRCKLSFFAAVFFFLCVCVVMMFSGLVIFLHAALLAYKTVPGTKKLKKLVHLAVQFLAMFLSLIGLWAVWKFHDERKIDHLYTLHSWLGLTCFIFFSLQVD